MVGTGEIEDILDRAVEVLRETEGENLLSVVFYGSRARGDEGKASDIDLFIVLKDVGSFLNTRRRIYRVLNELGVGLEFSPLILNSSSAQKLQPIHFELSADGIIVFDRDRFMETVLSKVKRVIEKIGARRYKTDDGCYGWVLKEGIKRGEVIELNI
jgi:hypothetical protein